MESSPDHQPEAANHLVTKSPRSGTQRDDHIEISSHEAVAIHGRSAGTHTTTNHPQTRSRRSFTENFPLSMDTDIQRDLPPVITSPWSDGSDHQLGHGSGARSAVDPSDRVFPIRSVVSVNPSQRKTSISSQGQGDQDYTLRNETTWDGRRPSEPPFSPVKPSGPQLVETISAPGSSPRDSPTDVHESKRRRRRDTSSGFITGQPSALERPDPVAPLSFFSSANSDESSDKAGEGKPSHAGSSLPGESIGRGSLEGLDDTLITTRFRHLMTDEGHAVITGRDGTLQRCEDEPIHTPGAVQSFGLLVALREETESRFSVRYVSENSKKIIGFSPQELFRLESFTEILSQEQTDNLLDHIDFIRDDEADPAVNGPDVFSISIWPPHKRSIKLWCALHINDNHPDLVICEFELEDDQDHPLRPPGELTPEEPEDTLYQHPTIEELQESTGVSSKPLRVLRNARKRRGEASAMQVFDIMSQVQEQLSSAPNLEKFLKILVGIIKELTGFHRVMIYQFDAAFNGKVVTELVDPAQTRDLYYGLHFPASDIPKQARDLYKLNKVRMLYDRDLNSARLVCRSLDDLEQPLDLSYSYLRAMSPIHLKYLANMAVRSSMSISINAFDELWGLIACHSYGPNGMRVPFPIRKLCRLIGDTASRNIERLSYAARLQARKLINTAPTDKNPSGYITASSEDLLKLFNADFGMLSIRGETKILGKVEQSQEALAMLEYLRLRNFTSVLTIHDIREDFRDLDYPPGFSTIAGLLYVPLSVGGHDFIAFCRKSQVREVKWAGNPYEKVIKEGTTNFLEPRSSFQAWHEVIVGKCREWSEEEVETAAVLCLVYGKFIEVWRQKEAALQSSRLTRLLLANSAHEVRTPLNAIINYLEIALEGSLDDETRENLARSHSASKSLIYVINDLLDLTNTEEGQELIKDEIFNLSACIREATEPFKVDAKRKEISYKITEHPGLPEYVHGDYRRVRQAVSNITANAMQHTTEGLVEVEYYVSEIFETRIRVEIAVQDTGCGMSREKLDNLFRDLEQVTADADEPTAITEAEKPDGGRALGLGLAVVARIVRNMDGQLRLKSEEGSGSRFVIQIPFELPTVESLEKMSGRDVSVDSLPTHSIPSVTKALPRTDVGELMLINRGTSTPVSAQNRADMERRSIDEARSISSLRSGTSLGAQSNKSDADRLIDAIQTPLSLGEPEEKTAGKGVQRSSAKEQSMSSNTRGASIQGLNIIQAHNVNTRSIERHTTPPHLTTNLIEAPPNSSSRAYSVTDTKTPIKPVKMSDECSDKPAVSPKELQSEVLFEVPSQSKRDIGHINQDTPPSPENPGKLRVLVAEDDPINMMIIKKRLEKVGHDVYHAVNGEDCATVYEERPSAFDVVLMDMQMPIVDGLTSTEMIRAFETSGKYPRVSTPAGERARIPIFAVSASLLERERSIYVKAGFDGWILKPIDFKRLDYLFKGIASEKARGECLYVPGNWERGGWFSLHPEMGGSASRKIMTPPSRVNT